MAPRLECSGGRVACAEGGCAARLPRGCAAVVAEDALGRLLCSWRGRRPDCVCLEAAGQDVPAIHVAELKEATVIIQRGGRPLGELLDNIVEKTRSAAINIASCLQEASGVDRLSVALPLERLPALLPRLASMLSARLRRLPRHQRPRVLILHGCGGDELHRVRL